MNRTLPYPPERVRHRYDRLARFYGLFEWLLWLPRGIRSRAVRRLELEAGNVVLEVGCGTGKNLPHLVRAVGANGRVYGVDLSAGMLTRARRLCRDRGWRNVTLTEGDALTYTPPTSVDAVLFSLSYSTMLRRTQILARAWAHLVRGGRLVILDGRPWPIGRLWRWWLGVLMKATVLGDLDHRAEEEVRRLTPDVTVDSELFGSYMICRGRKVSV